MKCIIAEKPSVARTIADVVGANRKKDGYLEGPGYKVTWAYGHLCGLALPSDYEKDVLYNDGIMCPKVFKIQPNKKDGGGGKKVKDSGIIQQLKVIKECFQSSDEIIVATDAGREGELIFRFIYNYLRCNKPFKRLWISSLTEASIKKGMASLEPGSKYDNLYEAGRLRAEADWIVGMNASTTLSSAIGRRGESLGRVQTPTLALICTRQIENKEFRSKPFWEVHAILNKDGADFKASLSCRFEAKAEAEEALREIQRRSDYIASEVAVTKKTINAPLLYDLTGLQKEANRRNGYTADETLKALQSLYEKQVVTYPRTGSQYIDEEVFNSLPTIFSSLQKEGVLSGEQYDSVSRTMGENKRCVDGSKLTDHHALLPTGNSTSNLGGKEKVLFQMIVNRTLEAFSPPAIQVNTKVDFPTSLAHPLVARGVYYEFLGWKGIVGKQGDEEEATQKDESQSLPPLSKGDRASLQSATLKEGATKPRPLYTDSSLLAMMETAGKLVDDEELSQAIKDRGIGTPATRASIIETLIKRGYVERQKKSLVATDKGLSVYEVVKDISLSDVALTGEWELRLLGVERGVGSGPDFSNGIKDFTRQLCAELSNKSINYKKENFMNRKCPKCGKELYESPKIAKCKDEECGFKLFKVIQSAKLTDKDVDALLAGGQTGVKSCVSSRTGKPFKASFKMKEDYSGVDFVFPD